MGTIPLSEAALTILRRRYAGEWVAVTEDSRPHYREPDAAALMYPVSGFAHGPESNFRFTEAGWNMRDGMQPDGHAIMPTCSSCP